MHTQRSSSAKPGLIARHCTASGSMLHNSAASLICKLDIKFVGRIGLKTLIKAHLPRAVPLHVVVDLYDWGFVSR